VWIGTGECGCARVMGGLKLAVVFLIGIGGEIGDGGFSESFGGNVYEL